MIDKLKVIFSKRQQPSFPLFEDMLIGNRIALFSKKNVDAIIDAGANTGQYAETILKHYKCEMISFEPMKKEYDILSSKLNLYEHWKAFNYGLGDEDSIKTIHVSRNSYSSSLLELNENTVNIDGNIGYVEEETIQVARLSTIWSSLLLDNKNVLLKIDTQGYEKKVLEGSKSVLNKINGLQIEMAIEELYKGEMLFPDMFNYITKELGFSLYIIEPGYAHPVTGKLLQVEAIFFR